MHQLLHTSIISATMQGVHSSVVTDTYGNNLTPNDKFHSNCKDLSIIIQKREIWNLCRCISFFFFFK